VSHAMVEHNGREAWPPEVSEQMREVDRLRRSGRYASALALIRQLAEAYPRQVRILRRGADMTSG